MSTRPNILVFLTDDHSPRAISTYDSSLISTPQIDRLAREGARSDAAFCTNAICSPSRATVLTGKYSHLNGVTRFNSLVGGQPTVPGLLRQAGYYTAVVGKWHLGSISAGMFDHWDVLPIQGEYNDPWFASPAGTRQVPGYVTDVVTDLSLGVLRRRPADRPFLLFVQHKAPHDPSTPRSDLRERFAEREFPYPPSFDDDFAGRSRAIRAMMERRQREETERRRTHGQDYYSAEEKQRAEELARGEVTLSDGSKRTLSETERRQWQYQNHLKDYLRCVAAVDESVGRILDELDRTGLADSTLVLYTSDHGLCLGDHGMFDKRLMYDPSIRVPLLARWPGRIPAGIRTERLAINADLMPTLLDAAGVSVPDGVQGRSLLPVWQKTPPTDWRTSFYYRFYGSESYRSGAHPPHYGVRTDRHKLIYFPETAEFELYDLQADPHEMNNLASSPAHAPLLQQLKTELLRLRRELDDRDQFRHAQSDLVLDNEQPDYVPQFPLESR
ncbi:MAG: sulfatase [Opitutae bacterium]|nr:sulfatase [Opitutae bacterium]